MTCLRRLSFWVVGFFILGGQLLYAESTRKNSTPDQYASPASLQAETNALKKNKKLTRQDIGRFSAMIHNVNILAGTESDVPADVIVTRPQGALKLDAVLSAEPAPSQGKDTSPPLSSRFIQSQH